MKMNLNLFRSGLFAGIAIFCLSCTHKRYTAALSPAEEISRFDLAAGFGIEPFASEPDVLAPVDMVFDEEGTIYVLEMADYPYKPEPGKGSGRIRVLKDNNHDGIIDTAIVFAQGLPSATSMLPWKGGLIVTAAPDILYLKDTTGDFQSDSKEVLFTGFFANNSEAQITSLRFGIDNWIYANNHGQAGKVTFLRKPSMPPVDMSGSDFRFRLDEGLFEKVAGSGQFGMAIDDWGHRFYTQNTLHIQQAPIAWKYLHRHDFLLSDNADVNISDHESVMFQKTPSPYWRQERSDRRQKEYDDAKLDRKEYAAGHFTGASGGTFYGAGKLGDQFYGSIFTGEVAGNLVHRDSIITGSADAAMIATRPTNEKQREFLMSADPWFRPTNFTVGPDGYLYVTDMYRQHIETPVSIPDDLKKDMDFTNGERYGRIFRIYRANSQDRKEVLPHLRNATSGALVALLSHADQWWRLQAQQLLFERQDHSVLPELGSMFMENKNPKARLHALYALEGMGGLNEAIVTRAIHDPEPGIREQAIIISERYPQLLPVILELTTDSSIQVALQATLTAGNTTTPAVRQVLVSSISRYGHLSLFRTAVLSSPAGSDNAFYQLLLKQESFLSDGRPGSPEFMKGFSYIAGARGAKEGIMVLLNELANPVVMKQVKICQAIAAGLAAGFKNTENKKADPDLLIALDKTRAAAIPDVQESLGKFRQLVKDSL